MISIKRLMIHDWRLLSREGIFRWMISVLILVAAYAAIDGRVLVTSHEQAASRLAASEQHRMEQERAVATRLYHPSASSETVPSYGPLHAMYVKNFAWFSAVLPSAPLEALCRGFGNLTTSSYQMNIAENTRTFKSTESVTSPLQMLIGSFDVAFVIITIYSLVVIAAGSSLMLYEQESGLMGLIRSCPVPATRLFLSRILSMGLFATLLAVFLGLVSWLSVAGLNSAAQVYGRLGMWTGVTLLYGIFWVLVASSISIVSTSASRNFLLIGGLWLLFIVVIPSGLQFIAARLYPVATRVEYVDEIRKGPLQFLEETPALRTAFLNAHPVYQRIEPYPPLGNSQISSTARGKRFSQQMDELSLRFDGQRQKQFEFLKAWAWLSPSLLTELALETSAGTGKEREELFRQQVASHLEELQSFFWPRIFQETIFEPADYDRIPRFHYQEQSLTQTSQRMSGLVLALAVWCLAGCILPIMQILRTRPN